MRRIRGVVFDLYGTLIHLDRSPFQRRMPRRLGIPARAWVEFIRRELLVRPYPDRRSFIEDLIGRFAPDRGGELRPGLTALLDEELASARPLPGVSSMLRFLRRRGLRLALLSNLASPYAEVIEALGLGELFDVVALSCERRRAKPDRELYLEVCRELGVEPGETLMVGDSLENDVRAPRAAGLESRRVESGPMATFEVGWLDFADSLRPLLAPGLPLEIDGRRLVPRRLEPVPDRYQGRYNLVVRAEAAGGRGGGAYYLKRYLLPESAWVEEFAGRLLGAVGLEVPAAGVLDGAEPLHWSREVAGASPLDLEPTPELAFDIGRHGAAAFLFSNADLRPRNALLASDGGRSRLLMIDFEHCLFNLALDLEGVGAPLDPRALDSLGPDELGRRLKRRVITWRSVRRIQREFFGRRAYEPRLLEPLRQGWIQLTREAQARRADLEQLLRERTYREPYLIIGTRAYRRAFAGIDIDDILERLARPPEEVMADWMEPGSGAIAP